MNHQSFSRALKIGGGGQIFYSSDRLGSGRRVSGFASTRSPSITYPGHQAPHCLVLSDDDQDLWTNLRDTLHLEYDPGAGMKPYESAATLLSGQLGQVI